MAQEIRPFLKINDSFKKIVTNKQIDVIKLINKGLSNKQIAYELNISESTVKVHITNILIIIEFNY